MNYIPAEKNGVYFPSKDKDEIKIRSFNSHILKKCMRSTATDDDLKTHFPGRVFFGRFLDPSNAAEIREALDVLRAVCNVHALLNNPTEILKEGDSHAYKLAIKAIEILNEINCVKAEVGKGYSEELNPDDSVPQCHVIHCEISLCENYYKWLKARIEAYEGAAQMFQASLIFYLNVCNSVKFEDKDNKVIIDVFGIQSLLTDFQGWLEIYESQQDLSNPSGYELIAGLIHLADLLATLHLITAAPVVSFGQYCRPTAGDSLTDFWVSLYDISEDDNYSVGACEVCNRLFIGTSKNKRGHEACMNRHRVKIAKARKFYKLIVSGVSEKDAAKEASISPKTARDALKEITMIKEYERVKTLVEKDGFPVGTMGVVVSIYGEGPGCEVELWDADNYPVDVVTYRMDELEVVSSK